MGLEKVKAFTNSRQLNDIINNGAGSSKPKSTNRNCIVSFIDDDAYKTFLTALKPIYDAKGVKCTIGAVASYIINNNVNAMSFSQLQELKTEGYDIVSHSYSHPNLGVLSDTDLDIELKSASDWTNSNGFNGNILVYPASTLSEKVRNAVKKYFQCGIDTTNNNNGAYGMPINTFNIYRYNIDSTALVDLKTLLDQGLSANAWVIFWTHSWNTPTFDAQKVSDLVDYVKSKNIPIMTVTDAFKEFQNNIEIGDKDSNYLFISKTGKVDTNTFPMELVVNGDFATKDTTGWTVNQGTWDFSQGKATTSVATTFSAGFYEWITCKPNTCYKISIGVNTGAVYVDGFTGVWGTNNGNLLTKANTNGVFFIVTQATTTALKLSTSNGSNVTGATIDNISIKEA